VYKYWAVLGQKEHLPFPPDPLLLYFSLSSPSTMAVPFVMGLCPSFVFMLWLCPFCFGTLPFYFADYLLLVILIIFDDHFDHL
jgi:hypothetical protein